MKTKDILLLAAIFYLGYQIGKAPQSIPASQTGQPPKDSNLPEGQAINPGGISGYRSRIKTISV